MKSTRPIWSAIGLTTIFLMVSSSLGLAREGVLPGKIGDYGKYFNRQSVESFSGKVLEVYQQRYSSKSSLYATAIQVERDDGEGEAIVYLGPKSRLDKEGFAIEPGEDVCILGSEARIDEQNIVIAQQLNRGNYVLALRNATGRHFSLESTVLEGDDEDTCLVAYLGD